MNHSRNRNKMESQKLSQTQYKIVYLISFINKFLGNNAASINIKKAIFLQLFSFNCFLRSRKRNCSLNRNRNK
jgi:hypothetical protein